MKCLVYTFRTFPYVGELRTIFPKLKVFGKLKQDITNFEQAIQKEKPSIIIGVAESNLRYSVFEPITINRFHKKARIMEQGKEELKLFIPNLTGTDFKVSVRPTDSFCNYTMYKIKSFIAERDIKVQFMFVHLKGKDIIELKKIINRLGYGPQGSGETSNLEIRHLEN